ncbi:T-cell receptor beta chain V region 3H.25 [Heterocephalus glaber]|nr:T-cell receptor beta chain V region 3H.25 [Heterocephalus glaber]
MVRQVQVVLTKVTVWRGHAFPNENRQCFSTATHEEEVSQTPGHLVKGVGQKVKMYCVPLKGHSYVFWYQQIPAKEFKILISFQNDNVFDKTGMPKERFLAECPQKSPCSLEIQPTELQDSAMHLCASIWANTGINHSLRMVEMLALEKTAVILSGCQSDLLHFNDWDQLTANVNAMIQQQILRMGRD